MARAPSAYLGQNHQTHERERNWNSCRSPPTGGWSPGSGAGISGSGVTLAIVRVNSHTFPWLHLRLRSHPDTGWGLKLLLSPRGMVCSQLEGLLKREACEYREQPSLGPGCPGAASAAPSHLRSRFIVVRDHFCQTSTGFRRCRDNCP